MLVGKASSEADSSVMLQVWSGSRMAFELAVPKALHGSLVEDGYFSSGPAWSPDEAVVA